MFFAHQIPFWKIKELANVQIGIAILTPLFGLPFFCNVRKRALLAQGKGCDRGHGGLWQKLVAENGCRPSTRPEFYQTHTYFFENVSL